MVRVLIDASALPENRGGVGRYVDELVALLPEHRIEVAVVAQRRDVERYAALLGRRRVHPAPAYAARPAVRLAWEQTGLPALVHRVAPDVVHSPHYTFPMLSALGRRTKQVVTLHDATFFSHPELHTGPKAPFFAGWTRVATRMADALVVPSRATATELERFTGVDPRALTVVPHGVDHDRFRVPTSTEVDAVRRWLGLGDTTAYVAFLGTLEPRKNVPNLVRAYVLACAGQPDPPTLVLAGGNGWDDQIDGALREVPADLRVVRPGFVPDGLVPALLGGATVVAYPALGEGFGLPVLEAMACGVPVLTTRMLSLPEVGGDAVAYAGTTSAADIAAALTDLLQDSDRRDRLAAAGLARAAGYTWDAAAAGHAEVYRRVMAA